MAEWSIVVPAPGEISRTARMLLELAGDPSLVRTAGNGTEFLVHPTVADLYTEYTKPTPKRRRTKKEGDE